jgi:signal transduction histidine kinase
MSGVKAQAGADGVSPPGNNEGHSNFRSDALAEACRLAKMRLWTISVDPQNALAGAVAGPASQWIEAAALTAFGAVHGDDRRLVHRALAGCVEHAKAFDIEFRLIRPRRQVEYCRALGRSVRDEKGRLIGLTGVCQDITERKQTELAVMQTEKWNSIGQLTGGIAHDFNNLLTVIATNLEMLADLVGSDAECREYIDSARNAAASGAALTARLLAFAQRQTLRPEMVPLDRFLASVRTLAGRTIGAQHPIIVRQPPEVWHCRVDRVQLESALLNLLVNARDAMPAGGSIVIEASNHTASLPTPTGLPPGDYVALSVEDEGAGIPTDIADRIFEPFFTTKPVGRGVGLGLSTALGFVRQSGGNIVVDSTAGEGTRVTIYLPRAHGNYGAAELSAHGQTWRPPPLRTLLIDDTPEVLSAVGKMCRSVGLRVSPAADAEQALSLLRTGEDFNLLLTDIVLPGRMGGVELARAAHDLLPSLSILYMSGYSDTEIVGRTRLDTDAPLLMKPFSRKQLVDAIRHAIGDKALVDAPH